MEAISVPATPRVALALQVASTAWWPVPLRQPVQVLIQDSQTAVTCSMTFLDANHCPGAVVVVLQLPGRIVVHTGDFRFEGCIRDSLLKNPALLQARPSDRGDADLIVYLDATFAEETSALAATAIGSAEVRSGCQFGRLPHTSSGQLAGHIRV